MEWRKLITTEKHFPSSLRVNDDHDRSEFERDHNKIIFSPFFRQLQNKTQLFPIPNSDFIHSRLTHSLEVASVGMSLGNLVGKRIKDNNLAVDLPNNFERDISSIVGAACLLHDVGNPPFGHAGEEAISSFYVHNAKLLKPHLRSQVIGQLSHFDGNAQTVRFIHGSHDLNLTLSTIATVMKYPTLHNPSGIYKGKHSIFSSELDLLDKVVATCGLNQYKETTNCRHPLVFLMEAADDICYRLLDLEDAHTLSLISYTDAERFLFQIIESNNKKNIAIIRENIKDLVVADKFAKLRSYALNILIGEMVNQFIINYNEIMTGQYRKLIVNGKLLGLIDLVLLEDSELSKALNNIGNFVKNNVYSYKPVVEIELAGYEILGYLLEQFILAIVNNQNSPTKKSSKLLQLLPERYRTGVNLEQQIMQVTDYIASQSDKYALDLYRKLKGIELPEIRLV